MNAKKIIEVALSKGVDEVEVYISNSTNTTIQVENKKLDSLNSKEITSYAIKGLYNGKMGYLKTEVINEENIDELIDKLILNATLITSDETEVLHDGSGNYVQVDDLESDYENYSTQEKIAKLLELESSILNTSDKIKKAPHVSYSENCQTVEIINSKGLDVKKKYSYMFVGAGAYAEDGNDSTLGFSADVNNEFAKIEFDRIIKEATTNCLDKLNPSHVKTKSYPVIFERGEMSSLLQAFFTIFSSDSAFRKTTKLLGREGEKVFGDNITIVDDPFSEDAMIKYSFDDEGYPCEKTVIVENGVFKTFLYNLKNATYFKTKSTGNGFGDVRPTNIYLQGQNHTKEDLIASVKEGIYVTDMAGLHSGLNPVTGDFNVQSSGRMIRDGKLCEAVTLFVISGNFFEMLNNVLLLANNIEKRNLGVAAPDTLIKELKISGK